MTNKVQPNRNQGLDIENLMGAPLVAATKANTMMLLAQTDFLLSTCFYRKDENEPYKIIMIDMHFETDEGNSIIKLPLLTIMPINSLAIDQVTVDFEMEITTQSSSEEENTKLIGRVAGTEEKQRTFSKEPCGF